MNYLTIKEVSEKWEISTRTAISYCEKGLIEGATYKGAWFIPTDTEKPVVKRGRKKEHKFTFVDLFCGVGGFHQAMASLGGKCVFACDINELCRKVYEKNYKVEGDELVIASDIKKVAKENNLPRFDVLCGGFPCQTFSKAGKQNGFKVVENENGETDDRGQLFFRIVDILQDHPECNYVVLENVRNLADKKNDWNVVCDELKALGFVITEDPIIESPHKFGIPQIRDRVYILGVKEAAIKTETLREKGKITRDMLDIDSHYEACPKNCIPMLLDDVADPKYYVPDELVAVLDIWEEFLQNVKGVKSPFWLHKAGLGIYDDEQYKNDPVIGYQDMPDWKKEMVWRSRVSIGLCGFLASTCQDSMQLIEVSKKLKSINFGNYMPLFLFDKIVACLTDVKTQEECDKATDALTKWLMSDREDEEATDYHREVILQLYRDCTRQAGAPLSTEYPLTQIAIHHFKKLNPEYVKKLIADLSKNITIKVVDEAKASENHNS